MPDEVSKIIKPKIGMVLSGGGVGAFAHIGVLKVLEQEGFLPDLIVGASGGALVGGLYAAGIDLDIMDRLGRILRWKELLFNPIPRLNGLISSENIKKFFTKYCPVKTFEEVKIPLAVTATDLKTGKQVVFTQGNLAEAIQASCSLPGLFTPVLRGEQVLIDGGILFNLPCNVAKDLGADFIIASDALAPLFPVDNLSSSIHILACTIYTMAKCITALTEHLADHIIRTVHKNATITNFKFAKELIELGEVKAREAIPELIKKYKEVEHKLNRSIRPSMIHYQEYSEEGQFY